MSDLASAYGMKKMGSSKCAHGGPIHCSEGCYAEGGEVSPKMSLAQKVMKKMAAGGEVESPEEEMREDNYLSANDDFSSKEVVSRSYPDPDDIEERSDEPDPASILMNIMKKRR